MLCTIAPNNLLHPNDNVDALGEQIDSVVLFGGLGSGETFLQ